MKPKESKAHYIDADLISRQDAINAIATWDWQEMYLPIHFKQLLEDLPPVDVVEVVHGEWLEKEVVDNTDEDFVWKIEQWQSAKCSVCGKYHTTPYMYYFDNFNYCPNCGAKMSTQSNAFLTH